MLLNLANFLTDYLPLWLPFIFAILSVIANAASQRLELTGKELLKVHGEMILGLFSFVTWALVTYIQNKRVDLNNEVYIDIAHIILLLIVNFFLLLFSIIALRHDWSKNKSFSNFPKLKPHTENIVNGAVLVASVLAAFIPMGLTQKIVDSKTHNPAFIVSVPYVDNTLVEHVGALRWHDRSLCYVHEVDAPNREIAVESAIKDFEKNILSKPMIQKKSKNLIEKDIATDNELIVINKDRAVAAPK